MYHDDDKIEPKLIHLVALDANLALAVERLRESKWALRNQARRIEVALDRHGARLNGVFANLKMMDREDKGY